MPMFLLHRLAAAHFGREADTAPALHVAPDPAALMATMAALTDSPVAADPIDEWGENDAPACGDA